MVLSLKILKNLQSEQKRLDEFIREKYLQRNDAISHDKKDSFLRVKIALLVEIGEFANELKTFKHWKKQKEVNWDKAKEELIDCLHFYLSLINNYQIDFADYQSEKLTPETSYNELLMEFFLAATQLPIKIPNLLTIPEKKEHKNIFYNLWKVFDKIFQKLGMEEKEVEKVYKEKNKINWERQRQSY